MKLKNYFVSKLIDTLKVEDSFFYKVKFEKKVKLTDELIALNYKKHAPFKNPSLVTLMEEQSLYIWFYEHELNSNVVIPEGYLLFNAFKAQYPNALLFIEAYETFIVLIIKDGILENSYVMREEDEMLISMEMNRYNLEHFQKIDKKAYLQIKQKSLESIGVQDLYRWSSVNVEHEKLLPTMVNTLAYPFAFLLFFIMAVETYHLNEVKKRLTIVEDKYSLIKSKNDDIREKINHENEKEQKWITFAQRELPYADPIESFLNISKAFSDKKFIFKSFSIMGSKVKMTLETKEDFIVGVNLLNNIEGLKNVALKASSKKRATASYEATLEKGAFW